jgi:recombinational DNA repair protein RecR
MNIDRLVAKRVRKMKVKDLKKALEDADDESEVILCFNHGYDDGTTSVYLADVLTHLKYDSVLKEQLYESRVCELNGYNHEKTIYLRDKNE